MSSMKRHYCIKTLLQTSIGVPQSSISMFFKLPYSEKRITPKAQFHVKWQVSIK